MVLLIISFFGASSVILAEPVAGTTNNETSLASKLDWWPGRVGSCSICCSEGTKIGGGCFINTLCAAPHCLLNKLH